MREARSVARFLTRSLQKSREQQLHVFRLDVVSVRQGKRIRCGAFLRCLSLRLPQPVDLSCRRAVAAVDAAVRPPRREHPASVPLQMASSAARRRERSGSGCQACSGA
ncbi:hypothetical protein JOB18_029761 [Solea senegalensis]|uniref:Uncharacterized protein n=1 Tax=Solea senegalensis TaxID=28829 RepID=A0AAV6RE57_SOLSE|nr:hypothetical protein JOB18_029761 [Solea senegalensis]